MSEPSTINEFVEEMAHLFRRHELRNGAGDITTLSPAQAYEVQEGLLAGRVRDGSKNRRLEGGMHQCSYPAPVRVDGTDIRQVTTTGYFSSGRPIGRSILY